MEILFFEFTVRAALIGAGTALILWAMQIKGAAARHKVWTGVMILMLALPVWTAWGPKAPLRVLSPLVSSPIGLLSAPPSGSPDGDGTQGTRQPAAPQEAKATTSDRKWDWNIFPAGVYLLYLLVACALLLRLGVGTARSRMLIRNSVIRNGQRTSASCAAPITVGWLRPVTILPECSRDWTPAHLDTVLTHEAEHARRRDPLVQWLSMLNRALFWFHPLAWWLERKLSSLAETACDRAVLEHGHDPQAYSEYLLDAARSVMRAQARVNMAGMAMPGSDLPRRIRQICDGFPAARLTRLRMACAAAVLIVSSVVFTSVMPVRMQAQDARQLEARQNLNAGVRAFRNGQPAQAVEHFKSAVRLEPELTLAELYLGSAYSQQYIPGVATDENKDLAALAIESYERVLRKEPDNENAVLGLASIYQQSGEIRKSREYYLLMTRLVPQHIPSHYAVGSLDWIIVYDKRVPAGFAEKARLIEEGLASLDRALTLDPQHEDSMIYKNLLLREKAKLATNPSEASQLTGQADAWFQQVLDMRKAKAQAGGQPNVPGVPPPPPPPPPRPR